MKIDNPRNISMSMCHYFTKNDILAARGGVVKSFGHKRHSLSANLKKQLGDAQSIKTSFGSLKFDQPNDILTQTSGNHCFQ